MGRERQQGLSRENPTKLGGYVMRVDRENARRHTEHATLTAPTMIKTRAGDVEAVEIGNPSGLALIFLPHGLGDWSSLLDIAADLAMLMPDMRLIALSRPGCGGTQCLEPGVPDPLFFEASVVLPALMDALGISSANFVGHADGASVALIFGGLFPERVLGVVGLAAYGFGDEYLRTTLEAISAPADAPEPLSKLISGSHEPDILFRRWRENRLSECERRWNAIKFFEGISVPVTLIQGARDEFISLDQAGAIAARIRGDVCWITLRNAGHFVHLENPEQVITLVQRQLQHSRGRKPPLQSAIDPATRRQRREAKGTKKIPCPLPIQPQLTGSDGKPGCLLVA